MRRGSTLVVGAVEDSQADKAVAILDRYNTVDISQLGSRYRETGYTGYDAAQPAYTEPDITAERDRNKGITIPIIEEQLEVGKREVQSGGARVHTDVIETPVDETVNLREEHVTVDRHAVNRPVSGMDTAFQEQNYEITETSEVPVIAKTVHVVEEVVIGKTATERVETVHDTVRRTDVEVEELNLDGTPKRQ